MTSKYCGQAIMQQNGIMASLLREVEGGRRSHVVKGKSQTDTEPVRVTRGTGRVLTEKDVERGTHCSTSTTPAAISRPTLSTRVQRLHTLLYIDGSTKMITNSKTSYKSVIIGYF